MMNRSICFLVLALSWSACGHDDGGSNVNGIDADTNLADADTNLADADTNQTDADTNLADADTNPRDADTNPMDAGGGPLVVEPLRAFPSAYGGGSNASGGRGGVLVIINTLDYSAPLVYDAAHDVYEGGIDAAFEDDLGGRPRYIVSNVAGHIQGEYTDDSCGGICKMGGGNTTFFGQSSPGGLTVTDTWMRYYHSENIILRYLTIRPRITTGDPIADDSRTTPFNIGASNVILDHCSASWGGDKAIIVGHWHDWYPIVDVTVQRSLLADSHTLGFSVDGNDAGSGDYDMGGNISWHYNFFAGGNRTPNIGGFDGTGAIQNNLVQSNTSKLTTVVFGDPQINHVANYYQIEADYLVPNRFQPAGIGSPSIFSSSNYYENESGMLLAGLASEDNRIIWVSTEGGPVPAALFTTTAHAGITNPPPIWPAADVVTHVLGDVGATHFMDDNGYPQAQQNAYDAEAIANCQAGILTYRRHASDWVLDPIAAVIRPASYDTDKDGMSDAWERRMFGDLSQGYNGDDDGDGYTNIEEYMNQVDYF